MLVDDIPIRAMIVSEVVKKTQGNPKDNLE